ncbi:MAG TPA: LysR family transcriptional regulator [Hellea balneolensis]|uniref:LysR family transcriptional regulator n=1 Tax=Hellea balneolensis TaxID=287478 RepID=A0A7V5NXR6_9PROT|nr:LysR family transcriptional regulator [Hellea balneolensis]
MPDSLDWDKVKTFHAAADTGSLTAAANRLRISQSAVSRQISALEQQLGAPLFRRHARGLTMTEQGRILFKIASEMSAQAALAQSTVLDSREKPQGVLRVSTPISLGSNWLISLLPEFMDTYPLIRIQLLLEDEEHDLSAFDVDCALRPWPSTQGDLIERKLGVISQSLYASHNYLARRGAPANVHDLDNHDIIAFGDIAPGRLNSANWVLELGRPEGQPRTPILSVNNLHGIMRAAEADMGIVGIPDYMVAMSKRLVRVLPQISGEPFDVYFVYPTELRGSTRVSVFRKFLMEKAKKWQEMR